MVKFNVTKPGQRYRLEVIGADKDKALFYESKRPPYLDNLLVARMAKDLKLEQVVVREALAKIRLDIDRLTPIAMKPRKAPDEATSELCKDPDFYAKIISEYDKTIEGEHGARKVIFLCASGRLVENAQPASYNLLVNSESGAGKDYIVSRVVEVLPADEVLKRTRISPTAFTYWHSSLKEPEWTWDGKAVYLEDASRTLLESEVVKVMSSGGSHATIVINQEAVDLEVRGKPVIIVTSASASPKGEMLRRYPVITLDESVNQTRAVMKRRGLFAEKGIAPEYSSEIRAALRTLKRVKVRVPFAQNIAACKMSDHIIMRTHFDRLLDYIKASVAIHQAQREKDAEGYFIATGKDYEIAREAFKEITSNPLMVPLTKRQLRALQILADMDMTDEHELHPLNEIETKITFWGQKWIREQLDQLTELNFLHKGTLDREKQKSVTAYRVITMASVELPTWDEVQNGETCRITSGCSDTSLASSCSLTSDSSHSSEGGVGVCISSAHREQREQPEQGIRPLDVFEFMDPEVHYDIATIAQALKVSESQVEEALRALSRDGQVVEASPGSWRRSP